MYITLSRNEWSYFSELGIPNPYALDPNSWMHRE